ncbi:hypothetical protein BN77_3495 [Rhizobium mesoamericanum STM3625]|uniref:Uncharacterized protein n=1 Tax=Rhizobium mesoamericanum STM3625 TaxID=1211777 RepID=K0PRN2_9HYPH|nr:hypothetical protein BN77_3495 [Rhizobium mesoamericanum STM3625]
MRPPNRVPSKVILFNDIPKLLCTLPVILFDSYRIPYQFAAVCWLALNTCESVEETYFVSHHLKYYPRRNLPQFRSGRFFVRAFIN